MPYKDPEQKKANQRKRYHERMRDPEFKKQRNEKRRKYYQETDNIKECNKRWVEKHKEQVNEYRRKYFKTTPWARTRGSIKNRIKRGKKGESGFCSYANAKCLISTAELKELWFRDKGYEMKNPSIDRIDPSKDYTKDNCRYLEMKENRARAKRVYKGKFPFRNGDI